MVDDGWFFVVVVVVVVVCMEAIVFALWKPRLVALVVK